MRKRRKPPAPAAPTVAAYESGVRLTWPTRSSTTYTAEASPVLIAPPPGPSLAPPAPPAAPTLVPTPTGARLSFTIQPSTTYTAEAAHP